MNSNLHIFFNYMVVCKGKREDDIFYLGGGGVLKSKIGFPPTSLNEKRFRLLVYIQLIHRTCMVFFFSRPDAYDRQTTSV